MTQVLSGRAGLGSVVVTSPSPANTQVVSNVGVVVGAVTILPTAHPFVIHPFI